MHTPLRLSPGGTNPSCWLLFCRVARSPVLPESCVRKLPAGRQRLHEPSQIVTPALALLFTPSSKYRPPSPAPPRAASPQRSSRPPPPANACPGSRPWPATPALGGSSKNRRLCCQPCGSSVKRRNAQQVAARTSSLLSSPIDAPSLSASARGCASAAPRTTPRAPPPPSHRTPPEPVRTRAASAAAAMQLDIGAT